MAQNISYTCDRCGYTQNTDRKFTDNERWMKTVFLIVRDGFKTAHGEGSGRSIYVDGDDVKHATFWCDKCCTEVGIKFERRFISGNLVEPKGATFESLVQELVRTEIDYVLAEKGL